MFDGKIVFIHDDDSWYLPYALYQAKYSSPDFEVVLLGQTTSYSGIKGVALEDLRGSAYEASFRKNYLHMSTNPESFELFCFLRWFFLLQYMRLNKVDSVFHFDSDVLLYSSAQEILDIYGQDVVDCAYMVPRQEKEFGAASAHMSFWTREFLERFCDFLVRCYCQERYLSRLKSFWAGHLAAGKAGGVCDMTLLYMFWQENVSGILNFAVERSGGVFNNNINVMADYVEDEYQAVGGMKKLSVVDGRPMLFRVGQEKSIVKAHALHFQGEAKGHMTLYYTGGHFKGKMVSDLTSFAYRSRKNVRDILRASGITGYLKGLLRACGLTGY